MKKLLSRIYYQVVKINRFFRIRHILFKNRKYTIVWMYPHIGDAFYALPYINRYKEIHNVKICLIGHKKYQFLYDLFEGIDKYYLLDEVGVFGFTVSHIGPLTRRLLFRKIKKGQYISNDYNLMHRLYPNHQCATMQEFTKKYIYQLNDEPITYPSAHEKKLNNKPYIIISPYAKTAKDVPSDVFETLVKALQKKYVIYSNVTPNQKEVEGTLRLECDILELADYVMGAKAFIGLRSGACDLVGAMTNTKSYIFFNGYKNDGFASVKDYRTNPESVVEFYGADYQAYIETIINDINKNG